MKQRNPLKSLILILSYVWPVVLSAQPDTAWVKQYGNPTAVRIAQSTAIAMDSTGNSYVTGYVFNYESGDDFVTAKYNQSGQEEWQVFYKGDGQSSDRARNIAIDKNNDIYVCGATHSEASGSFTLVKYNESGQEIWTVKFGDDYTIYPKGMILDSFGNILITGNFLSSSPQDIITAKFNSDGQLQWSKKYAGAYSDYVKAISSDAAGRVYVTGWSYKGTSSDSDIITICYNPDGSQKWFKQYNGLNDSEDQGYDIVADSAGNVYVTGIAAISDSDHSEYFTVKYDTAGTELWVMAYSGEQNTCISSFNSLDSYGNLVVTGRYYVDDGFHNYNHIATVSYTPDGRERWVSTYSMSDSSYDRTVDIVCDRDGYSYVLGYSKHQDGYEDFTVLKYDSAGSQQWVYHVNSPYDTDTTPSGIAVHNNLVFVTGSQACALTVGLTSLGEKSWQADICGEDYAHDQLTDMEIDLQGNAYITGYSYDYGQDFVTIKYKHDGQINWQNRHLFDPDVDESPSAITIDADGNTFVTGNVLLVAEPYLITTKYNAGGEKIWHTKYENSYGIAIDIAVDNEGNVSVLSQCFYDSTGGDFTLVNYSRDGNFNWAATFTGFGNGPDSPKKLAVSDSGNIYVAGTIYGEYSSANYCILKYAPDGQLKWSVSYNSDEDNDDQVTDFAIDSLENIYVTGTSYKSASEYDIVTIKYNSSGQKLWSQRWDGSNHRGDYANALAVDHDGNVYVAGFSYNESYDRGVGIYIKYNASGAKQWSYYYKINQNYYEEIRDIEVGSSGSIYAAVLSGSSDVGLHLNVLKFSQNGQKIWEYPLKQYPLLYEAPLILRIDNNEDLYVSGTTNDKDGTLFLLVKVNNTPVSIGNPDQKLPVEITLFQNYPNPFNPLTKIPFFLPRSGKVKICLYSVDGQLVREITNQNYQPGRHEVALEMGNLSSGLYFYSIDADNIRIVKKMLLVK